ncbi:MAG: demethoxyubiquinone hydroxylase family protein [Clostridia bacterium]|nr:demethoxyubiquinone hydroxylase family protein [Clostridia bacterium]MDD4387007.1 demethoxyubiquinone hydroxylase family protein [Clostridia bacterium]
MALLGNPFVGNIARQMTADELAQAIRVDIAGELEAIIGYEAHILATSDERAKKILRHIADEEKNHIGELHQLLYILSPKDAEHIGKGNQTIQKQQESNFQQPIE